MPLKPPEYAAWLTRQARLARPRVSTFHASTARNTECYLAWRRKWETGYVALDAYNALARFAFDLERDHALKRARAWLVERDRLRIRNDALATRYVRRNQFGIK